MRKILVAAVVGVIVLLARPAAGDPYRSGSETVEDADREVKLPDRENDLSQPVAPVKDAFVCDPWCKIGSSATIITDRASVVRVPPGRYIPEPLFQKHDADMRRLQDAETRLTAENTELKKPAPRGWSWVVGFAAGIAAGAAGTYYLTR
jgi:hypothetical protein